MLQRTVLISGASVAGPALAFWLHRYGFHATLVERAAAPRAGGQAIDLRGAAREVAERMGLMPEIRARHTGARGMSFVDRSGKRVASMNAELGGSGGVIANRRSCAATWSGHCIPPRETTSTTSSTIPSLTFGRTRMARPSASNMARHGASTS